MYDVGRYYVFFVPPGWLLAGRVASEEGSHVVLSEAAYLELVEQDKAILSSLPLASAKEAEKVCRKTWPMPQGTVLHRDGILIAVPCASDLSKLTRSNDVDTIRGAR